MGYRLIYFPIVSFWLLMFNFPGNFGISKIEIFNFSRTERVKLLKTIQVISTKTIFLNFFTETLTLSLNP